MDRLAFLSGPVHFGPVGTIFDAFFFFFFFYILIVLKIILYFFGYFMTFFGLFLIFDANRTLCFGLFFIYFQTSINGARKLRFERMTPIRKGREKTGVTETRA